MVVSAIIDRGEGLGHQRIGGVELMQPALDHARAIAMAWGVN
jgi:hypothetical protein